MPLSEAFPLTGEGRLPLSGGDVERSETEGVGEHGAAVTDEGEKSPPKKPVPPPKSNFPAFFIAFPQDLVYT